MRCDTVTLAQWVDARIRTLDVIKRTLEENGEADKVIQLCEYGDRQLLELAMSETDRRRISGIPQTD